MNCRLHSVWGPCPICDAKRISDLTKELAAANARADAAQAEAGALRGAVVEIANAHPDGNPFRLIELARAALAKVQP